MSTTQAQPDPSQAQVDETASAAVGVVLATHNRPQLMRQALGSILGQDYAGAIHVVLVFDGTEPETELARGVGLRTVTVTTNNRHRGLAGARNTGVLALDTEWVAFCDDDDTWLPDKLSKQVQRLRESPDASFVTTAMAVIYDGRVTMRLAGKDSIRVQDLARSRMAMLHSSSFLFRRSVMVDGFGLVDETLPRSMAEDWDLLLRAARYHTIAHVDEPLVQVLWGQTSYFNAAWRDKNEAHAWMLEHHPEVAQDRVGAGLMFGKLAFGHAALGDRRQALAYARRSVRANWREPRALLAALVVLGVPGRWVQGALNRRGHGI